MDVASAKWLAEVLQGEEDYNSIFNHQYEINSLNQLGFASDDHIAGDNYKQSFSSESYSSYSTITTKQTNNVPSITTSSGSDSIKNSHDQALNKNPSFSSSSSQLLSFDQKQYSNSPPNNSKLHHDQKLVYGNLDMSNNNNTTLRPKREAVSLIDMNFFNEDSLVINNKDNYSSCEPKTSIKGTNKRPYSMIKTPSHAQDHIMAERKRREKLTQRFIALSAIVPGLKKMDKASVLGDAIVYVKQLQERVSVLEEQTKSRTVESVVFKKSQVSADIHNQDSSSSDQNFEGRSHHDQDDHNQTLPEVEARFSEKDVLIRIHCEKQKGIVVKILSQIEKLDHLSVVNTNVLPFGNCTLDITILAQVEKEFSMTMKDLVKSLRKALLKIM